MEEKLRILLCEDDESLGMLLREYLQAKGYEAELFPDGDAGYKAFLKNRYEMCVLDVMMPKKDGFQLAQEIRQVNPQFPLFPWPVPCKEIKDSGEIFADIELMILELRRVHDRLRNFLCAGGEQGIQA